MAHQFGQTDKSHKNEVQKNDLHQDGALIFADRSNMMHGALVLAASA
jgi:hypothetical protein